MSLSPRCDFSVKGALIGTAIVGIAAACAFSFSHASCGVALIVTTTILLFATTAAIVAPPATRVFWIGFAVFGWGYFVVTHIPEEEYAAGTLIQVSLDENYPPKYWFLYLYHEYLRFPLGHASPSAGLNLNGGTDKRGEYFATSAQLFSTLAVASVGAFLGQWCFGPRSR